MHSTTVLPRWSRVFLSLGAIGMIAVTGSDAAQAIVYTAGAVGNMGAINFTGQIASAISLEIVSSGDASPPSAPDINNGTTLPLDTISMGLMNWNCTSALTNVDCYRYTVGSTANYVATLTATLTFSGAGTMSLEIYRDAAVAGSTFASGKLRAELTDGTNWKAANGTALLENPAIAAGFPLMSAVASGTAREHQIAVAVDQGDATTALPVTTAVTYRTF